MAAQCPHCARSFTRPSSLNRHVLCKHSIGKRIYQCFKSSNCSKTFARPDILRRHEQNYHDGDMELCTKCPRSFRKDYLKQHLTNCGAEKPTATGLVLRGMAPQGLVSKDHGPEHGDCAIAMEVSWQLNPDVEMSSAREEQSPAAESSRERFTDVSNIRDGESRRASAAEIATMPTKQTRDDAASSPVVREGCPVFPQPESVKNVSRVSVSGYVGYGRMDLGSASPDGASSPPSLTSMKNDIERLQLEWPHLGLKVGMAQREVHATDRVDMGTIQGLHNQDRQQPFRDDSIYAFLALGCCAVQAPIEFPKPDLRATLTAHINDESHCSMCLVTMRHQWEDLQHLVVATIDAVVNGSVSQLRIAQENIRRELSIPATAYSLNKIDELLFEKNKYRLFPLATTAKSPAVVEYLLDSGLDSNTTDDHGRNALHWACSFGNVPTAKVLIRFNLELIKVKDDKDARPLDIAVARGHLFIAVELVRYTFSVHYEAGAPLKICCQYGNAAILKTLLGSKSPFEQDPWELDDALTTSLLHGSVGMVQLLLDAGATLRCEEANVVNVMRRRRQQLDAAQKLQSLYEHKQLAEPGHSSRKTAAHCPTNVEGLPCSLGL